MEAVFASPDALVAVGDGGGMWPGSHGAVHHASTGAPQPLPGGDPTTGCSCPVLQLRTRLIEELRAEGIAGGSDTKALAYVHPVRCMCAPQSSDYRLGDSHVMSRDSWQMRAHGLEHSLRSHGSRCRSSGRNFHRV